MKGKLLLIAQLLLLALLASLADFKTIFNDIYLAALVWVALLIGFDGLLQMGARSFSPFPEPSKNNRLVQKGVYSLIRHPMYTALIILGLVGYFSRPNLNVLVVLALLISILSTKADFEEELLTSRHPTYKKYQQTTKKFLPFIY